MKYAITLFIILLFKLGFAQTPYAFIESYNRLVDPNRKLDTIKFLTLKIKSSIKSHQFLGTRSIEETNLCKYTTDGYEMCVDVANGNKLKSDLLPLSTVGSKDNLLKYLFAIIIFEDKEDSLLFKIKSDSLTVIERVINPTLKKIYTFDTRTKSLLQTKCISTGSNVYLTEWVLHYKSYKKVEDLLMPTSMYYESNVAAASLDYEFVSFRPFKKE